MPRSQRRMSHKNKGACTDMGEEDKIVKTIRACLLTNKNMVTIRSLDNDYKAIVGTPIPYRRLGFPTLKDYLLSIPYAVNLNISRSGEVLCSGRADSSTAHVALLVHGQKSSKGSKPPHIRNIHHAKRGIIPVSQGYNFNSTPKPLMYIPVKPRLDVNAINNVQSSSYIKRKLPVKAVSPVNTPKGPEEELFSLCEQKRLPKPELKTQLIPMKAKGKVPERYVSKLKINDVVEVPSFPALFPTAQEAERFVCAKALPKLIEYLNSLKISLKESRDAKSYVPKVKELVGSSSTGMFGSRVEAIYTEKYREKLPPDWKKDLHLYGLRYEQIDEFRFIVFPVNKSTSLSNAESSTPCLPEPLALPSCEEEWFVFVTYVTNTKNFGVMLIGDNYNSKYESLMLEVGDYCSTNGVVAHKPQKGGLYVANVGNDWLRVEVLNVDIDGGKVSCYFCDMGDEDTIEIDKLYVMLDKFAELPYQAIHCVLSGLEDYESCENITANFVKLAVGQTFVAQVIDKAGDKVNVVLYDTSTVEDININQILLEKAHEMCPSLPIVGDVSYLYLTHIDEDGNLFVQPNNDLYPVYEKAITKAQSLTKECAKKILDVEPEKMYLAKYSLNDSWYRAIPVGAVVDGKVTMQFIDYGNQENVKLDDVREVADVYPPLLSIPRMAVECFLAHVPPLNNLKFCKATASRLRELAPEDEPLLIKTVADFPPCVEIFIRRDDSLVCVNTEISKDLSLFKELKLPSFPEVVPGLGRGRGRSKVGETGGNKPPGPSPAQVIVKGLEDVTKPLDCPDLPAVKEFFDVLVVCVAHPGNFTVQPYQYKQKLAQLTEEMTKHYSSSPLIPGEILEGCYYAGLNTNDSSWYRIRIDRYHHDDVYSCHLVDFGEFVLMNARSIQPLLKDFRVLPSQAIKAQLAGITPIHGDWTPEDVMRFNELTKNRPFVSVVKEIIPKDNTNSVTLSMLLVDTSDDSNDVYIHDILVDEKRAKRL